MTNYASFMLNSQTCLENRALAYGDGLFETMLVINGELPLWQWHMQRLQNDLPRLNIQKIDEDLVLSKIQGLCPKLGKFIVKLVVFRAKTQRGYTGATNNFEWYINIAEHNLPVKKPKINFSKIILAQQKQLAGMKHLCRLEQILAANALIGTKYNDAIMLVADNNVIETINKNIVLVKNNKLFTPKLNKCGVYGVALRWLAAQGFTLNWRKIKRKQLSQFDGMLLCNSITGFKQIKNIKKQFHFKQNIPIITDIKTQWFETLTSA